MQKQPLMIGLAAGLLLIAVLLGVRQCRGTPAGSAARNELGLALADRVAALVGGAGPVVLLTPSGNDADTPESAAFAEALSGNRKGLQRLGCEAWAANWGAIEGGGFLSAATYAAVAAKYPAAAAIVSFEGVPAPGELGRWPSVPVKLVVVSMQQPRELILAAKPAIQAAYVARPNLSSSEMPRRGTPDQIFNQIFEAL